MDYYLVIAVFLMGGLFSYLVALAIRLLVNASKTHAYRTATAIAMIVWSLELLLYFVQYSYSIKEGSFFYYLSYIYSFALIPPMAHIVYCLVRREKSQHWILILVEFPYLVITALFDLITPHQAGIIALIYSVVFLISFLVWYIIALSRYKSKLANAYSDPDGFSLGTFYRITLLMIVWIGLYMVDFFFRGPAVTMCYYGMSYLLWGLLNKIIITENPIDMTMLTKTTDQGSIWVDLGNLSRGTDDGDRAPKQYSVAEIKESLNKCMEEELLFLDPHLTIRTLADKVGISIGTLTSYLNTCRGLNFSTYITGLRLQYAAKLLSTNPTIKTSQLAAESGFTTTRVFSRLFKRRFGVSVRQFSKDNLK